MLIWIGDDLAKPGLTLQQLKDSSKIRACYFDFDHQNDEIIPTFQVEWYYNQRFPNEMFGFAMQNHCDQPYMFKIEQGKLKEGYELTILNQFIYRPLDPETDEIMEPADTLGECLGFQMLRTRMVGVPEKLEMTLLSEEGEEELPYPQMMIFYSLDGNMQQYQVFTRSWRNDSLTIAPSSLQQIAVKP